MPHSILILGSGRSSSSLISYLIDHHKSLDLMITIGDVSLLSAQEKAGAFAKAIQFDISDKQVSREIIRTNDIVISLLPAALHPQVAELCIELKKHLLTASYVSEKMKGMNEKAKELGLLFLNECGLDPGLDHMTAMELIDDIKQKGGIIESFESFTGGLIAPTTDIENPWRYKFTWNPRNVVVAGQGTAKFLQNRKQKYIPYQQLFKRTTSITLPNLGDFEGYANRDSLSYLELYGLQSVNTMIRGTLRNKGYCAAWDIFVQLGCTDDTYELTGLQKMTHRDFIELFLHEDDKINIAKKLLSTLHLDAASNQLRCLEWSGFFSDELIGLEKGTPAQLLEHILNKKWKLSTGDKDHVVMWHRFTYTLDEKTHEIQASMSVIGDDSVHTAMAKTVGLPLAIAAKLLIQRTLKNRGVVIPTSKEIYEPILKELSKLGIELKHH